MDAPTDHITSEEDTRIKSPVRIPLLLQIEGEPRLTIEEDGRIIHKGAVIAQDQELADMLMGLQKRTVPPRRITFGCPEDHR